MKLAYVGLPCQIEGLRKAEMLSDALKQEWPRRAELYVGLFCRENWSYTCFKALIEDDYGVKLEEVTKFDIKKKNIVAFKGSDDKLEFPLAESRPYVRIGCQVCIDFSCELADIAIGAVGSPLKWSTVIVRTEKGMELLKGAEAGGYVLVKPLEEVKPGAKLVKRLSREKREEALKEVEKREGEGIRVPHVSSFDKTLEELKAEAKGKAFEELDYEVIDTGLCSACGACEAACPEDCIKVVEERPVLLEECKAEECNACYVVCPRVALPLKELRKALFKNGQGYEEGLGEFLGVYAVRAKSEKVLEKGQDGGAVTALMSYALDNKLVDGVVSVKSGEEPWKPVPAVSRSSAALLETSGTHYSYATTIPAVKKR
jgi:coenzyme F420 hydrogenase subunit beta